MDVLVLGGSIFLGRAVVAESLAAGHTVTVFNRGVSAAEPEGATHLRGDRTAPADLEQLRGQHYDLVVDTCGYVPSIVGLSLEVLRENAAHYAFVSSVNAFPGWPQQPDYHPDGVYDGDPDATEAPADLTEAGPYGWLKVGCERAVERAFGPERTTILRAGCIVGPHDASVGRLPWWIHRVAQGGEVLVPGDPTDPMSLVDARDLAQFALLRAAGTFEASGPRGRDTRADLMTACLAATRASADLVYTEDGWLTAQGVEAWTEVPLWIDHAEGPSVFTPDPSAAEAAGLRWRPLTETVADTWAWMETIDGGWTPSPRTPGLATDRERSLISTWRSR
jgi:2'-hydroxyisoflavone reductase